MAVIRTARKPTPSRLRPYQATDTPNRTVSGSTGTD